MVGLSSFLLISYWFTRIETSLGAILAILMNRVGDVFFILGILISFLLIGSVDILTIISSSSSSWNYDLLLIPLFLAAMAKSAQLSLHIWLPYSMEGPTPISALLHAATMVTAGVFLLLRLSLLLSCSYYSLLSLIIIGGLTTFVGGTLAWVSLDMKELIAYSTMSQLGLKKLLIIYNNRYYTTNSKKSFDNLIIDYVLLLDPNIFYKYEIKLMFKNRPIIYAFYNLKTKKNLCR